MSKNSVLKRSGVFVGAVVVCAAGSFMVATPAQADPACQNYEFPTTGQRMTGRAYSTDLGPESNNYPYSGSPSGSIDGTTIDFTVAWDNGQRSHYFGTVMGDGHGAGERDDIRAVGAGPDNTTWHTADPMKCIRLLHRSPRRLRVSRLLHPNRLLRRNNSAPIETATVFMTMTRSTSTARIRRRRTPTATTAATAKRSLTTPTPTTSSTDP